MGYNNNGTVKYCYVSSKVTGSSLVGADFGQTSGANVSNCICDSTYTQNVNVTGSAIKTPAQMTGTSAVSSMGFSSSDWRATADDSYFYYYPQLASMYNMTSVKSIKDGSVRSVKRVQDKYVAKVQIDGRTDTYYENLSQALDYVCLSSVQLF